MARLEPVIESGSPALKVVDLRVVGLENKEEDHTKELQRHMIAIDSRGLEVKKVGGELTKMTIILSKIKTLMIGFGAGFLLNIAYQEGAVKGITSFILKLVGPF